MGGKLFVLVIFGIVMSSTCGFAWKVPDTGQTECYDDQGRTINCPESGQQFSGQDGSYLINPPAYTKLDENANSLPDSAESWVMIKDNVTGLIWEKKTNKDGATNYVNPHDADNVYDWYDSNPNTNGGNAGNWNDGRNTEVFIADLNAANFGGFNDWRMPSRKELKTIGMYGPLSPGPAMNKDFFPNTKYEYSYYFYWASDTYAGNPLYAWYLCFTYGSDGYEQKYDSNYARAVRGETN